MILVLLVSVLWRRADVSVSLRRLIFAFSTLPFGFDFPFEGRIGDHVQIDALDLDLLFCHLFLEIPHFRQCLNVVVLAALRT